MRERIYDQSLFDKDSFRTIKKGKHIIILGCPKGKYNHRCRVSLKVQSIRHPLDLWNSECKISRCTAKASKFYAMKKRC